MIFFRRRGPPRMAHRHFDGSLRLEDDAGYILLEDGSQIALE